MNEVELITNGAGTLSTYGLYAVCVAVVLFAIHLYRRVNQLEDKLHAAVEKTASERGEDLAKWQVMSAQMQEVIRANTKALERFSDSIQNRGK